MEAEEEEEEEATANLGPRNLTRILVFLALCTSIYPNFFFYKATRFGREMPYVQLVSFVLSFEDGWDGVGKVMGYE